MPEAAACDPRQTNCAELSPLVRNRPYLVVNRPRLLRATIWPEHTALLPWSDMDTIYQLAYVPKWSMLAGSGKTIVLALKAAFLHSKEPDWRIVLTFQTRSLYQQFRRLIRQFCFEFSKQEPDWDKLTVLHAWGSGTSRGVYAEVAGTLGQLVADFSTAKNKYGIGTAFGGVCADLLAAAKTLPNIPAMFDVILIDEAQDLPQPFFELIYLVTNQPKRSLRLRRTSEPFRFLDDACRGLVRAKAQWTPQRSTAE